MFLILMEDYIFKLIILLFDIYIVDFVLYFQASSYNVIGLSIVFF